MKCRICGKEIEAGSRFCGYCGTKVETEESKAAGEHKADLSQSEPAAGESGAESAPGKVEPKQSGVVLEKKSKPAARGEAELEPGRVQLEKSEADLEENKTASEQDGAVLESSQTELGQSQPAAGENGKLPGQSEAAAEGGGAALEASESAAENAVTPEPNEPATESGTTLEESQSPVEGAAALEEGDPKESLPQEKAIASMPQWAKYIGLGSAIGLLVLSLAACLIVNLYHKKSYFKTDNGAQQEAAENTGSTITAISLDQKSLSLGNREMKKLEASILPKSAEAGKLIWSSDQPEVVSVDENGLITALKEGGTATITVKSEASQEVSAQCEVKVLTKDESFMQTVYWINSNDITLEKINVYEHNFDPSPRDLSLEWDSTLFYTLENIDQTSDEDGLIDGFLVEKKQLINETSGNIMEYEIYIDPATSDVNKIVSIEYIGDELEIIDYYYDKGKVNFIFKRTDSIYTPTYASPDKVGERYYFNQDVLVKWRAIYEPLKINDRFYDKISGDMKQQFESVEEKMLNAAYNTYNTVLQARSIGYVKGYVTSIEGMPMSGVSVKVVSNDYKVLVSDGMTDGEGYYNLPIPTNGGNYSIIISYEGYVTTTIYNVQMNREILGAYQENVYLVPNNSRSYSLQILLSDAFNKLTDTGYNFGYMYENDMVRLSGATLNIRSGINNREGQIYTTAYADMDGMVMISLPAGTYTGEIIKSGYVTSYFTIVSKSDNEFIQSTTTPTLGANEVRIVLTWGSNPSDLDSHLFTPYQGEAGDMQHIGYYQKSDTMGNNLDVDDTSSYGPETMTIGNLDNGSYKYYVADFTNCSGNNYYASDMSLSGAKVSVYTKDGLVQVFNVPRNKEGVIWEVFEIRNKQIVPIQRYYTNISDKPWWSAAKFY